MKMLREQAKEEARELVERYNVVYVAFLIDELEKSRQKKLAQLDKEEGKHE